MTNYNIFDDSIPDELKEYYEEDLSQTRALLEASNLIHEAMVEKGINQTELAKLLNVTRGYVSRILSGNENMSIKNVARVLHVLGKTYTQNSEDLEPADEKNNIIYFKDYSNNKYKIDCNAKISDTDNKKISIWENNG